MFSLFKKFIAPVKPPLDAGPTYIDQSRMTFEERKTWRQGMMHKSIKEVFSDLEIISGMYRYRALPIDERGHYYVIVIETTRHFALSKHISTQKLSQIEVTLKSQTFENYGLIVDGVYWKANETIDVFDKALTPKQSIRSQKTIEDLHASFCDTQPMSYDTLLETDPETGKRVFDPLTEDEARAFKAALATGLGTYNLKVGGKVYDTDIAPLS